MTPLIQNELETQGFARVIISLKQGDHTATSLRASLGKNFISTSESPERAIAASLSARGLRSQPAQKTQMRFFPNLNLMLGTVDAKGLASLKANKKDVKSMGGAPEISLIRPAAKAALKKLPSKVTWGLQAMDVPALWKQGLSGKGVLVGHLDTGMDGEHPALKKAWKEFQEFDELGFPVTPTPKPWDSDDHGTHTAATIAGRPVKGMHVGVAPEAKLLSGMIIEGGDVVARVLAGMDWIVASGARVLSMSLGLRGYWGDFLTITQALRENGVLPIFAVGNEGAGKSRSPGNYVEALSVGAYGKDKAVAEFSGSQRFNRAQDPTVPDLVGPGVDVPSAMPGGGYQLMDGSSMATPHLAGLAALLFEAKPAATIDEVEQALFDSCELPGSMQGARAGRGVPNGKRAIKELMG